METTATIKEGLKHLIDLEEDPELLNSIKDIITRKSDDEILREKLMSRSRKEIEDYEAGRVLTPEEVSKRIHKIIYE